MSVDMQPPAAAYFAWVDAIEALEYDYPTPDYPPDEPPVAIRYIGPDGRGIAVTTNRLDDLTAEMAARGCELAGASLLMARAAAVRCPATIAGFGW